MGKLIVPCFVINMKRDKEKREYMERLLEGKDEFETIFFEAFDGALISPSSKIKFYNHLKSADAIGRRLTRGEIGCAISHLNIYKYVINNNVSAAIVLEDDVTLGNSISSVVQQLLLKSSEYSIVLLGSHVSNDRHVDVSLANGSSFPIDDGFLIGVPSGVAYGTYGYFISNKGAREMIDALSEIYLPIDHYSGNPNLVDVKVVVPSLVKVNRDFEKNSNIDADRKRFMRKRGALNYRFRKKMVIYFGLYGIYRRIKSYFV